MLNQEVSVIKNFLKNDLVQLLVAESNRLPAPYGATVSSVVGAVAPLLVEMLIGKIDKLGAPAIVAPAAPAIVVP